jgi:hypothetical protein
MEGLGVLNGAGEPGEWRAAHSDYRDDHRNDQVTAVKAARAIPARRAGQVPDATRVRDVRYDEFRHEALGTHP